MVLFFRVPNTNLHAPSHFNSLSLNSSILCIATTTYATVINNNQYMKSTSFPPTNHAVTSTWLIQVYAVNTRIINKKSVRRNNNN